ACGIGYLFHTCKRRRHKLAIQLGDDYADGAGGFISKRPGKFVGLITYRFRILYDPFLRIFADSGMIFQSPTDCSWRKIKLLGYIINGKFLFSVVHGYYSGSIHNKYTSLLPQLTMQSVAF